MAIAWLAVMSTGPAAQALQARQPEIGEICARDIDRFCPNLAGITEPQNQRICLRPYHYSLTIGCRHALSLPAKPLH